MHITVGELAERPAHTRNSTLEKWQQLWDETTYVAQWIKRLISSIREWVDCRHRRTCYFLTKALSGHGTSRTYRKRIGKIEDTKCLHCDAEDTVEHTIFHCDRWMQYRQNAGSVVVDMPPKNMVAVMLSSKDAWMSIQKMVRKILSAKQQTHEIKISTSSCAEKNVSG
nr:unnamed protein product [Callosobruchus chinensis]